MLVTVNSSMKKSDYKRSMIKHFLVGIKNLILMIVKKIKEIQSLIKLEKIK